MGSKQMTAPGTELYSFGALLKAFRKRRRLTQQELSEAIGAHRSAIVRWEQGDFLPHSKALVLELARHLHLDGQEARSLLEASLTALSPHWYVPVPRNLFFTGREEILEALHIQMGVEQAVALTQSSALHGLGGVGKTQIALEYAYRHALEYSAVFWIGAETEEQVVSSFLRIVEVLGLPEREETDQSCVVAAAQRWLSTHGQWLLIWDNLEDLALLDRFLPPDRQGAILLTTRAQALGTLARGVSLFPMEPEEGMLFLLRRAKVLDPATTREQLRQLAVSQPGEYATAEKLVEVLGGLPLALDQAGAYLEETGCRLADYLQSYGKQRARFLARRGTPGNNHPDSVGATFRLIWQRVQQEHPTAAEFLSVCAYLHAEAIPEELFLADLAPLARSDLDLALAALRTYSLVQRNLETRTFSLHRLVQVVLQEEMSEPERATYQLRAVRLLNAVFPEVPSGIQVGVWERCERLLPHVLTCAASIPEHLQDRELAELFLKGADYLYERSQHQQAKQLGQRALGLFERTVGLQHPQVATALHRLACLAHDQGQYAQAEQLFQQALRLGEQSLGSEHPQVATLLKGLAHVYLVQGRYQQAEQFYLRALHMRELALGPEHPDVAPLINNLGILYQALGQYEQAERLYLRVLRLCEQTLGLEHPDVARPLNNLADLYLELGQYEQAEPYSQRALSLFERALGPEHPDVAALLETLATLYREWGKYEQARPLYQRALRLFEQTLGPEHPKVVFPLKGLAMILSASGEYEAAESLYERALCIQQQACGPEHPEIARILAGQSKMYEQRGRLEQAEPLLQRAYAILAACLGQEHPETVKLVNEYHCFLERTRMVARTHNEEAPEPTRHLPSRFPHQRAVLADNKSRALLQEDKPLQKFLDACCELHPRAWCRSADLWQAYRGWVEEHQERYPLSQGAFIVQLKVHGCRADRTKTARIWRGIGLVTTNDDGG